MEKRKIILCPNPYRDKDMHVAAQSKAILDEAGFETIVCLPFQKEGYGADMGLPIGQLPQEIKRADLLIAFGGDGTILHLAKTVAMNNVPVLGINLGSLGFMSELEPNELDRLRGSEGLEPHHGGPYDAGCIRAAGWPNGLQHRCAE